MSGHNHISHFISKVIFDIFLSGGRGEDSSVIITLPECSAFSDIPEEALAKVFTYLTLIPRCVRLHLFLSLSLPFFFCSAPKKPSACILSTAGFTAAQLTVLNVLLMPSMSKPHSSKKFGKFKVDHA